MILTYSFLFIEIDDFFLKDLVILLNAIYERFVLLQLFTGLSMKALDVFVIY